MILRKHPLLVLFSFGLILRLCLVFLDFSFDVNSFMAWGKDASVLGFKGFYDRPSSAVFANLYPNYPPLAIYLFYLSYGLYTLVNTITWQLNTLFPLFPSKLIFFFQSRSTMAAFFKLPAIFADLGIAVIIVLFVQKLFPRKKSYPRLAASLILFNPAFFYNSAYWGQTEAIPIFFLLLSFYFLVFVRKASPAAVSFTLALLSKQTVIVFVPVFLLLYFKQFKKENIIKGIIFSIVIFWLMFIPFYQNGNVVTFPFVTYYQKIVTASGLPFISNHAFNFWAAVSQWKDIPDTKILFGMPYRNWGYLITGFFIFLILRRLLRRKYDVSEMFLAAGLCAYASFLFLTRIHERHFVQVLPFFIPLVFYHRNYLYLLGLLSFVHFFNLYHNWPVPKIDILVSSVRSSFIVNLFILIFLTSFFFLLFFYLYENRKAVRQ